jgi:hypothetical protein
MLATPCYNGQGLGNFLANYVAVRCLALDKGLKFGVIYPEQFTGKSFMKLDMGEPVGDMVGVEGQKPSVFPLGFDKWYKEETNGYDLEFYLQEDNTVIHGLLQGVDYFKHRKDEVREWLKVEERVMDKNVCVINFRGGEYKWVKDFFLPQSYWDMAIAEMKKTNPNMVFEVHTDDRETAEKFFPHYPIYQDIAYNWRSIRYAHYLILSNSSFAILPAYLGKAKRVIAPWGMGRYNTGEWLLEQNYVPEWHWLKPTGEICTG